MRIRPAKPQSSLLGAVLFGWALVLATAGGAETVVVTESFTSLAGADTLQTTANWDTTAGKLRLWPQGLAAVGALPTAGEAYASAWHDSHLLLANGSGNALLVIDPADPTAPALIKNHSVGANARSVTVQGDWAFVSLGSGLGVQMVNVADAAAPVSGPRITLDGFTSQTVVDGSWAYAAIFNRGVGVIEITDPASPVVLPDVDLAALVRALDVQGGYLYLAADNTLTVLSLAVPAAPDSVAAIAVPGTVNCVTAAGTRAYLGGSDGLDILDISQPAAPQTLSHLSLGGGTVYGIAVQGDSLFVANGDNGLQIVDISELLQPEVLVVRPSSDYYYHTLLHGGLGWVSNGAGGLQVLRADPQGLDAARNVAVSIPLNPGGEPLQRVRLVADFADSIRFSVTADGGTNWLQIPADDSWLDLAGGGSDLRWRAELFQSGPWPGPVCNSLTVTFERRHSYAEITAIDDVPDDDGGRVRLTWRASRFDAPNQQQLVDEYSLYRRYEAAKAAAYPPGAWEYLMTVPADQESSYTVTAPTLADSTAQAPNWAVFFVRSRTPEAGVYFDSPPDSGYSLNNLAPLPPTGFVVARGPTSVQLSWDPVSDPDFAHFRLYRSNSPLAPPAPVNLYLVTTATSFTDVTTAAWYYQLTVVDLTGHESAPAAHPSAAIAPASAGGFLGQNTPNPFNPATRISYVVPPGGRRIRLDIYDFRGSLVRRLASGLATAGEHTAVWRGRDERGRQVAAGLYTCRLRCGDTVTTMKMALVR